MPGATEQGCICSVLAIFESICARCHAFGYHEYGADTALLRGTRRSALVVNQESETAVYANISLIALPLSTTRIGRPCGVMFSFVASMPSASHMVACRSPIWTGLSFTSEPVASDDP